MPLDAQDAISQFRANMGRVFDTYPRMMLTPDSPFQRYVQGSRPRGADGGAEAGPQAVHRQGRLQRLPQRPDADRQQVPQRRRAEHLDPARQRCEPGAQPRAGDIGGGARSQSWSRWTPTRTA